MKRGRRRTTLSRLIIDGVAILVAWTIIAVGTLTLMARIK